jgi:hypothetical protein
MLFEKETTGFAPHRYVLLNHDSPWYSTLPALRVGSRYNRLARG